MFLFIRQKDYSTQALNVENLLIIQNETLGIDCRVHFRLLKDAFEKEYTYIVNHGYQNKKFNSEFYLLLPKKLKN